MAILDTTLPTPRPRPQQFEPYANANDPTRGLPDTSTLTPPGGNIQTGIPAPQDGGGLDTSPGGAVPPPVDPAPGPVPGPTGNQGNGGINPNAPPPPVAMDTGGGIDTSPGGTVPGRATQPVSSAQALQQAQAAFTQRFGRAMTPQEQELAVQVARQNGWNGGDQVPPQALNAVLDAIQTYNPGGQGGAPTTPTTPTTPTGPQAPVDPNVARQRLDQAFLQRFGRPISQQELQWLQTMAGYSGGTITEEMMGRALDAIGRYTGNQNQPFEPPEETSPEEEAARRRLQELLGLSYGEVDMNSDAMRQQMDTYRRNVQQGSNRLRAQQAERAAREGSAGTGGSDVLNDAILQKEAEGVADFQSGLIGDELKTQRATLQEAIQLAIQTGQQDKARELQERLGEMDIDLRRYLGKGQLGLGLLQALMGDQQFYDRLGLDWAGLQNKANTDAINAILRGL